MKRTTINLLAAVVMVFGATAAFGQASATDQGTATATIISAITLNNTTDLAFGDMLGNAAGTVTISSAGARSASGVTLVGGTFGAANFNVTGGATKGFTVALPAGSINITRVSGTETMAVGTFTSSCPANICTTSNLGAASFTVGGTLTVAANQAVGNYTGPFSVTVTYQ